MIRMYIQGVIWTFRISWRHMTGRWYVFRDAPDWFVNQTSIIDADRTDPGIFELVEMAKAERMLRRRKRRMQAKARAIQVLT